MAFSVAGDLYFEIDGQLHEIKRLLRQKRGCPYDPALVKKALQAIVEGRFDKLVEVPISDELQQLIGACKFHSVDDNIMGEKFPLEDDQPDYEYSLEVLHLNKGLTTTEVLDEIKKQGYEVASLRDLLVYCAEHSKVGLDWPLSALGSTWQNVHGGQCCPFVWRDRNGRRLDFDWLESRWINYYRFLVRRKKTVSDEETSPDELQQLIGACGFGYVEYNITTENFPLPDDQPDYEYSLEVLHFNKRLHTTAVLDEIKKQGYEVASLRDLLVYCAEHQEVGLEWPLVALGSVWQDLNGDRGCPCVWSDGNGQHLLTYLRWFDGGWGDRSRFLVRSKRQP